MSRSFIASAGVARHGVGVAARLRGLVSRDHRPQKLGDKEGVAAGLSMQPHSQGGRAGSLTDVALDQHLDLRW